MPMFDFEIQNKKSNVSLAVMTFKLVQTYFTTHKNNKLLSYQTK